MKFWGTRPALAALVWTAIAAAFALPYMLFGPGYGPLMKSIIRWWMWGALVPLIVIVTKRLAARYQRPLQLVVAHACFGGALATLCSIAFSTLEYRLGADLWNPWTDPVGMFDMALRSGLVYCLILGAIQVFNYYRRHLRNALKLARLERSFLETRLNGLRMQLDPHFLFNSLNGISAYVGHDPTLARKMIEHLSDLLALSLQSRNRQQVSLSEEMAFLDHYLALHRMRFEERLKVTLDIMPEVLQASIPSLLLQPLVENAIRHGIAGRVTGGRIEVSARRVGSKIDIRVRDDGVGLPPGWRLDNSHGLGLSVTRERLAAMYPNGESSFTVARRPKGGTVARIVLPLELSGAQGAASAPDTASHQPALP